MTRLVVRLTHFVGYDTFNGIVPDKSAVIKEAQKYLAKGQIEKAIAEWEKFAKETPDSNTYNTIGDLYLKKDDKKSAVEYFHKAARYFKKEGFSQKTFAIYKKIIHLDQTDVNAFSMLAELSEGKGLVTDAIKYYLNAADTLSGETDKSRLLSIYEKVLSLAPFNMTMRDKIAGIFLKEGLPEYALREYVYIARFCLDRKDIVAAKDYFHKALTLQADNKSALAGLAYLYENMDDNQNARQYIQKAITADPEDTSLLLYYAKLLRKIEAYDEAIVILLKLLELKPSDPEAQGVLGEIYAGKGERQEAWGAYKSLVDSLSKENKFDRAIELANQFKDTEPVEVGKILISLYSQKGDLEAVFNETIFVAALLSDSGNHEEALDYYLEALKLHPDNRQLREKIDEQKIIAGIKVPEGKEEKSTADLLTEAEIFIRYGLYNEARSLIEELKLIERTNTEVHMRLKAFYLEMNDLEEAVTECLILAAIYERTGETLKREAALKEAFGMNPEDSRVLEKIYGQSKLAGN